MFSELKERVCNVYLYNGSKVVVLDKKSLGIQESDRYEYVYKDALEKVQRGELSWAGVQVFCENVSPYIYLPSPFVLLENEPPFKLIPDFKVEAASTRVYTETKIEHSFSPSTYFSGTGET